MLFNTFLCASVLLAQSVLAQFPSSNPSGVTVQQLQDHPGVSISYKQADICGNGAPAWAGYVHMPSNYLTDVETSEPYAVSMFFLYSAAQQNPGNAPTSIFLAGGPGSPSSDLERTGPCEFLSDSNSTAESPWSWNTHSNMLYIDQPVSTGFSYTSMINSTLDLLFLGSPVTQTGIVPFEAYGGKVPAQNTTFLYGTFSEQNPQKTANTTLTAAKTLWHFTQAWLEFAELKTQNTKLNLWGNSYGGYYVPVTAAYMVQQNEKISSGTINGTIINVDSVGWTNGCVDLLYQGEWYPEQAYNNTYDLQVIPKAVYEQSLHNFTKAGGCRDQILECRSLGDKHDPDFLGISKKTNTACINALVYCFEYVSGGYSAYSNRSVYDMAQIDPNPIPPSYASGFFSQEWVQRELGVPVNYTAVSLLANNAMLYTTGDTVRTPGLKSVEYLLDHGVRVTMIYGDRDYRCPWNGAEKLSLATKWEGASAFNAAGYEYVHTNASYNGAVVRQHGNLSFARVFEAGHDAQGYQPETVYRLFNRATFGKDLATGKEQVCDDYSTTGPASSFNIKNVLPPSQKWNCNLWNIFSCTIEQYEALAKGTAEIDDFKIVKPKGGSPGSLLGII